MQGIQLTRDTQPGRCASFRFAAVKELGASMTTRVIGGCRGYIANVMAGSAVPVNGDNYKKNGFIPASAGTRRLYSGRYDKYFEVFGASLGSQVQRQTWRLKADFFASRLSGKRSAGRET